MEKLTQKRLHELFNFDADAGALIWQTRPVESFATVNAWRSWNTRCAGKVAGYVDFTKGYRRIGFDGGLWKAHRLIWIYANGDIPGTLQIDHINGVRDDNRLANLRLVTNAENHRNQSMRADNTSGVLGVRWGKRERKWRAEIKIDGRRRHLGYFDTLDAAAAARARAEVDFGFHPGHGKVSAALLALQENSNG